MNALEIPDYPDKPYFKEEVELFGKIFSLEFELLESVGYRVLHIYDEQEKSLALGIRMVPNWPLFQHENISFIWFNNKLLAYAAKTI